MRRFDLDTAAAEFTAATTDWAIARTLQILGELTGVTMPDIFDYERATQRLAGASAVLAWEQARAAAAEAFPGPVYDDDTIAARLGGITA